jgi:hypothetical protein
MVIAAQAGSLIRINGRDLPLSTPIGLSKPHLIDYSLRRQAARFSQRSAKRPSSSFHLPRSYSRKNIAAFRSQPEGERNGRGHSVQNHRIRPERTVHNLGVSSAIRALSAQPRSDNFVTNDATGPRTIRIVLRKTDPTLDDARDE